MTQLRFDPARFYTDNAVTYADRCRSSPTLPALERFAADLGPTARVLDPACGPGRDLSALRRAGLLPTGSDIAHGALALSASRNSCVADFRALPFQAGVFDGVWASAALVHADRGLAATALDEFARVTRSGGLLYCSVKHDDRLDLDGFDAEGRWFALWPPYVLAALASVCGWQVDAAHVEPDAIRAHVSWTVVTATRL